MAPKGSAGDSLSDWWLIQCFDCSYCSSKQAILEGKIDFKLCFHRGACTIPNTTLKEFLLKIQFSERKFSFLRLSFVPFLIGFLEFRPVTVTNFTHINFKNLSWYICLNSSTSRIPIKIETQLSWSLRAGRIQS